MVRSKLHHRTLQCYYQELPPPPGFPGRVLFLRQHVSGPASTTLIADCVLLVFKRWCCQLQVSADKLLFRVMVRLAGISAHAWSVSTTGQALGPSCANLKPTPSTIAKSDLR
jgi:hypothetical protein